MNTEDMLRAASRMHESAETIRQAANTIHEALERFAQRLYDDHIMNLTDSVTVKWEYKEELCQPANLLSLCQAEGAKGWRMVQTSQYPERMVMVFFERRVRP